MSSNNNDKFNPNLLRKDFPILDQEINGAPLAYLDNAASTQKPKLSLMQSVIITIKTIQMSTGVFTL